MLVDLSYVATTAPVGRDAKLAAAIAWLGQRHVLHKDFRKELLGTNCLDRFKAARNVTPVPVTTKLIIPKEK